MDINKLEQGNIITDLQKDPTGMVCYIVDLDENGLYIIKSNEAKTYLTTDNINDYKWVAAKRIQISGDIYR